MYRLSTVVAFSPISFRLNAICWKLEENNPTTNGWMIIQQQTITNLL
jgi:hypothetical protein